MDGSLRGSVGYAKYLEGHEESDWCDANAGKITDTLLASKLVAGVLPKHAV